MHVLRPTSTLFLSAAVFALNDPNGAYNPPELLRNSKRTDGGIHIPIHRREVPRRFRKRGDSSSIGLGDIHDVTYSVLMQVGQVQTPLVLDTGSSDLWVVSDKCSSCNSSNIPLYPQASLKEAGLDVDIRYGDSFTGTHARGLIGRDTVGIAGLELEQQPFAAINDTDTTVLESGSAGIFGLGFPPLSSIWRQLLSQQLAEKYPVQLGSTEDPFHKKASEKSYSPRRLHSTPVSYPEVFTSFSTFGPLVARMVAQNSLASPMITITLQRNTLELGGNMGMLSIGELPEGVKNESITWVPVARYGTERGGLAPPSDALNETYPLGWEVPLEGIYVDGTTLPASSHVPNTTGLYALLDTGNSLIRGQRDLVDLITDKFGGEQFSCDTPHNLSFKIAGKLFPVDPRDLIQQAYPDSLEWCSAKIQATDPPNAFLHSWSLGDPFLKSALVVFYYGDLVYPSRDPPRVGFLSTVPSNADSLFKEAIRDADTKGSNLPLSSEAAPSGQYMVLSTGIGGVPQALHTGLPVVQDISSAATSHIISLAASLWMAVVVVLFL